MSHELKDTGKIVTVAGSDYIPKNENKKVVLNAMSKLENGIKPSTKSLNDFKAERLAKSIMEKDYDITITESKPNIVDEFYGIASNVKMSLDDIRDERLGKQ